MPHMYQIYRLHVCAIHGLVPSRPRPPAENVWRFDLNFLSLTPFPSGEIAECTTKSRYVIEVQNGSLNSIPGVCKFCAEERTLCISAVFLRTGYNKSAHEQTQAVCKFARGKDVTSCFTSKLTTENQEDCFSFH